MSAQPRYITQPDFDAALTAFSGHVDHTINMSKADLRREIIDSENRLSAKIEDFKLEMVNRMEALEARMQTVETRLDNMQTQLDRVENVGKQNHQMFQIMLDQLSKINKKLGTD